MKRLFATIDALVPWLKPALVIATVIAIVLVFGSWQCSRQEAAQSKQDARSATAGTKTAKEALTTLEGAQERDAGTDQIVAQGKKEITDAQTDVDAATAGRRALCKLRSHRDDPACAVSSFHP
jgi:hypothetical protein